ncbi:hypothetical protein SCHPADRAFT_881328 [Schizopora paradoxa]|uniref:Cytochrome P450 n=1 Tax=Schizopora paradoxa TaxID=27342 RepID=A0A0H2RDS1_9AGAM|nr:hypothetical protein SCHPADRAFT_881328 [Schizopora paradoxa]
MLGSLFGDYEQYATFLFGAFVLLIFARYRRRSSRMPFPPGPPRIPIIGNLHQMTSIHLWETAAEWSKQYGEYLISSAWFEIISRRLAGDLIYVESAGIPMLMINSFEIASDLLVKRSAVYSSRPYITMFNELHVSLLSYFTNLPFNSSLHRLDFGWATSMVKRIASKERTCTNSSKLRKR